MSTDQRIRTVLARMEVFLSYGTTQAFDATGSKTKATGGDKPSGDSHPVHELYKAMYNRAQTARDRLGVCVEAESELGRLTRQKDPDNIEAFINRGTLPWKRAIANSELNVSATAARFGVSRATVYWYQEKYGFTN